jgi:signal transduction histidine kinase
MVEDCDRLLGTVEQVLRAGRLRAAQARGGFRPVDLAKVVDECLSLAQTRYRLTPGELTYKTAFASDAHPRVLGDEDDLKAVVLNLVDNAIKYSGDKVTIAVELAQTSSRAATIRVSDRGVGIPVSELGQIFKRFYRIPGVMTARIKGAGLGLFIVRAVVARHGGTVFAESDGPGLGTTFTVQLPLTSAS